MGRPTAAGPRLTRMMQPLAAVPTRDPSGHVLELLETARIRWALASPSAGDGARDIDLVVDQSDLNGLDLILSAEGFVRRRVRGANRLYIKYDVPSDSWIVLDVATRFRVGPCLLDARDLLQRRRRHAGLWALSEDDAFWLRMLQALARRQGIAASDRDKVRGLAAHASSASALARIATWWCGPGWSASRIRAAAFRGDWNLVDAACLQCRPRALSVEAAIVDSIRRPLVRFGRRLARAWPWRGFAVAVIGPDGAGKSTLATSIVERSALPGRVFYMGLHAPVGGAPPTAKAGQARRPLPLRIRRQARRLWRLTRTSLRAMLERTRGGLVVFDRYTYDADVHWVGPGGAGLSARRWLVRHTAPRPDLVVLLDVPADVMYARKGEHSPAILDQRRRRYLELAAAGGFAVVDGTQSAEDVRAKVTGLVWSAYADGQARR
jgi:thymidylate kinase